jgi:hypothetical protein
MWNFGYNSTYHCLRFDMYPEGAPLGNKFQSTQVKFR